jgi:KRAB domain-containing zinc finger protein
MCVCKLELFLNLLPHTSHLYGLSPVYKCGICERDFSLSNSLLSHIRSHTRDKPYKCDICGKRFSWNWNLERHIRTHSGDNPM